MDLNDAGRSAPVGAEDDAAAVIGRASLAWARSVRANERAIERRAKTLAASRPWSARVEAAWLLLALRCIDLTTLSGDDTPGRVRQLAALARRPLPAELQKRLGLGASPITVASVCVYHNLVTTAVDALAGTGVPVCAVSAGFPAGQVSLAQKADQVSASVEAGATEIDIVISRAHVLMGAWDALYDEVVALRNACTGAQMKAILATGELGSYRHVAQASRVCLLAGADFIKTSTGKEPVNATVPVGITMARALRAFTDRTGHVRGLKPAGGLKTSADALAWLVLVKEELGDAWLSPSTFRIGASGILGDIVRRLEQLAQGDDT